MNRTYLLSRSKMSATKTKFPLQKQRTDARCAMIFHPPVGLFRAQFRANNESDARTTMHEGSHATKANDVIVHDIAHGSQAQIRLFQIVLYLHILSEFLIPMAFITEYCSNRHGCRLRCRKTQRRIKCFRKEIDKKCNAYVRTYFENFLFLFHSR